MTDCGEVQQLCPNAIPMVYCKATGLPCAHAIITMDGKCDLAKCANAVVPTWADALKAWKDANEHTVRREQSVIVDLNAFLFIIEHTMEDRIALTDDEVDTAVDLLLERYKPATVCKIILDIKALLSDRAEVQRQYRKMHLSPPRLFFRRIPVKRRDIAHLTPEQRVAMNQTLYMLRRDALAGDPIARRRFLWCWFAWRTATRPSDIGRLKWDCVVVSEASSVKISYVPHKTAKSTNGRKAGGDIGIEEYCEIKPFIGKPDEYVIEKFDDRIPKDGHIKVEHGECVRLFMSIRRWVVNMMHSLGVVEIRAGYVLRKDCALKITEKLGPLHAAQMLGDNPVQVMNCYADFNKARLREGL